MEVKPGYKKTELGVIPEDWETPELGAILKSMQLGGNYKNTERQTSWPLIKMGNLGRGNIKLDRLEYVDSSQPPAARDRLRRDDVLFNTRNTLDLVGKVAIWRDELPEAYFNSNIMRMEFDTAQVLSSRLMNCILNTPRFITGLRSIAIGTTSVAAIYSRDLVRLAVLLPTKPEQEAIAEALSDADALIESLEQLLAKKRHLKQGAMQELLTGKRRLPGFEVKAVYKQTEVGEIPEDWNVVPLSQCLKRIPAYGINAPAVPFDYRLPTYLRITDITDDGRFVEAAKASVDHHASLAYLLELGDIVFARTGASVGKSYLYNPCNGSLVFAGFLIRLTPDPTVLLPEYLSYFAQSHPYWSWVKANSMRSGQPGINGHEYSSLPIPLPSTIAEQSAIASILSDMDTEIAALETKLVKARQIKQGMMQELLTGRIRLV